MTARRLDPILSPRKKSFSSPSGLRRSFHIDEAAAARSVFGGLSASAAHTFAIFISLTNELQPQVRAIAGLDYDELRLPNAVRPGDDFYLEATTLQKRESKSRPDSGIVRASSVCATKRRNGAAVRRQRSR
ncbi:MaoC/PaaZ C-terminal domain-containing protein [Bradyrhizobium zhanjiangense]|uniref:MaoC/PaaZ C-terminal domain-containing protein n=1 Tax=Bradyrhizobium zhanjiangense TaxID=1325107 RepID=UPI0013E8B199